MATTGEKNAVVKSKKGGTSAAPVASPAVDPLNPDNPWWLQGFRGHPALQVPTTDTPGAQPGTGATEYWPTAGASAVTPPEIGTMINAVTSPFGVPGPVFAEASIPATVTGPLGIPLPLPAAYHPAIIAGMYPPDASSAAGAPAAPDAPATDQLFSGLEQQYGLPQGYLGTTYGIESNYGKNAGSSSAGALGPFQFIPSTAASMGLTDRRDLGASADAAARLAVQNGAALQQALGRPPTAGELYLAHQQGAAGAIAILTHPDMSAVQALQAAGIPNFYSSIAGNLPPHSGFLPSSITGQQFANLWGSRFAPAPSLNAPGSGITYSADTSMPASAPPAPMPASVNPTGTSYSSLTDPFYNGVNPNDIANVRALTHPMPQAPQIASPSTLVAPPVPSAIIRNAIGENPYSTASLMPGSPTVGDTAFPGSATTSAFSGNNAPVVPASFTVPGVSSGLGSIGGMNSSTVPPGSVGNTLGNLASALGSMFSSFAPTGFSGPPGGAFSGSSSGDNQPSQSTGGGFFSNGGFF